MKRQVELIKLIREVKNLIIKFVKPHYLNDEVLEVPDSIKRMGTKLGIMGLCFAIVNMVCAFLLKITNLLIEERLILVGIIVFMIFLGHRVIMEAYRAFASEEKSKFDAICDDEIILRISRIIGKTSDKVIKYDERNKIYKVMTNEEVLRSIRQFLKTLWRQKTDHDFEVLRIISTIIMLFAAIIANTIIPQSLFVPLILMFVLVVFLSTAYSSIKEQEFYKNDREFDKQSSLIMNDLLRVPLIVKNDLEMRTNRIQKIVTESKENIGKFRKNVNKSYLYISVFELIGNYGITIFYLLAIEWKSIDLATITGLTAAIMISSNALSEVRKISRILYDNSERISVLEKESADILLILDVFRKESEKLSESKRVNQIVINPFSMKYIEMSENDKPFTLSSSEQIYIKNGEIAILYGPSGSGKSTFMKMLTGRIRFEKSTEIPSTSRFLFYDEKVKFGSLSIFEELFCGRENPDFAKMQKILENLYLWDEIKSNCIDVWKWMKEKKFEQSLSNGQKQRLILAKMMYWLDDEIDVVILDECTSGLDDKAEIESADAERILEYIVRYVNSDKKRITIISTHQNIDGFKEKLSSEYTFKNFQFVKEGEYNLIKKI